MSVMYTFDDNIFKFLSFFSKDMEHMDAITIYGVVFMREWLRGKEKEKLCFFQHEYTHGEDQLSGGKYIYPLYWMFKYLTDKNFKKHAEARAFYNEWQCYGGNDVHLNELGKEFHTLYRVTNSVEDAINTIIKIGENYEDWR